MNQELQDGSPAAKLKSLKGSVRKLGTRILELKEANRNRELEIARLKVDKSNAEKQINQLKKMERGLIVSEHALLRFLERANRVDVAGIATEIACNSVREQHRTLGDGNYPIGDTGLYAVVKDSTVVTVK